MKMERCKNGNHHNCITYISLYHNCSPSPQIQRLKVTDSQLEELYSIQTSCKIHNLVIYLYRLGRKQIKPYEKVLKVTESIAIPLAPYYSSRFCLLDLAQMSSLTKVEQNPPEHLHTRFGQEHSARPTNPTDPIPPQHPGATVTIGI